MSLKAIDLTLMLTPQVKALEAADAARRKDTARAADRCKQKDVLEQQKAERAKHAMEVKVMCPSCRSP